MDSAFFYPLFKANSSPYILTTPFNVSGAGTTGDIYHIELSGAVTEL